MNSAAEGMHGGARGSRAGELRTKQPSFTGDAELLLEQDGIAITTGSQQVAIASGADMAQSAGHKPRSHAIDTVDSHAIADVAPTLSAVTPAARRWPLGRFLRRCVRLLHCNRSG